MAAPHLHPHSPADLVMAPVLIEIERNLERLRASGDLEYVFALELNDDQSWYHSPRERAHRVQQLAVRNVDLHGWDVYPTPDLDGLVVAHGEYQVSVMLGKRLAGYVDWGAPAAEPSGRASAGYGR